ncbi:DUF2878 domain-containing protein [Catenovulum agarivorans]|uniref:DUF2878 domain-containing protein n=1 Tax=Catenovulum agarivorans TaxID=1172192 RepID=UPI00031F719F|nr:DUF2878 domain-containing protein [Catenovulum agarivorans]
MKKFWLVNLVLFQLCWLLAAFYQQQAVVFMLLIIILHFVLSPTKKLDFKVLPVALAGMLIDQILMQFAVVQFVGEPTVIPIWLMSLWVIFSFCLNHSLNWLNHIQVKYVVLLGATFGPISYFGGLSLGAFETSTSQNVFLLTYAAVWAIFLPLSRFYCQRFILESKSC